ncbi:hypothetical protein A3Q56_07063 [Intoshia linei]|uniref:Solute carrier organic anion transporter family member n=1 Tax=Intoshia linei TaxID=1819745 RepID=A0A177AUY5_9BILA|nr:hypothetical protein A3Q56_07063 [Intoshia linei]
MPSDLSILFSSVVTSSIKKSTLLISMINQKPIFSNNGYSKYMEHFNNKLVNFNTFTVLSTISIISLTITSYFGHYFEEKILLNAGYFVSELDPLMNFDKIFFLLAILYNGYMSNSGNKPRKICVGLSFKIIYTMSLLILHTIEHFYLKKMTLYEQDTVYEHSLENTLLFVTCPNEYSVENLNHHIYYDKLSRDIILKYNCITPMFINLRTNYYVLVGVLLSIGKLFYGIGSSLFVINSVMYIKIKQPKNNILHFAVMIAAYFLFQLIGSYITFASFTMDAYKGGSLNLIKMELFKNIKNVDPIYTLIAILSLDLSIILFIYQFTRNLKNKVNELTKIKISHNSINHVNIPKKKKNVKLKNNTRENNKKRNKNVKKTPNTPKTNQTKNATIRYSDTKTFNRGIWKILLKPKLFVLICSNTFLVMFYYNFKELVAKYFEKMTQTSIELSIKKTEAPFNTGVVMGSLITGSIFYRIKKPTIHVISIIISCLNFALIVILLSNYLISCNKKFEFDKCQNQKCDCIDIPYPLAVYEDNATKHYINPCYGNCILNKDYDKTNHPLFTECGCKNYFNRTQNKNIKTHDCHVVTIFYIIIIFNACFCFGSLLILHIYITFKIIKIHAQSTYLGIIMMFITLFSIIPSTALKNYILNNSCHKWSNYDCPKISNQICLEINIITLRNYVTLNPIISQTGSLISSIILSKLTKI